MSTHRKGAACVALLLWCAGVCPASGASDETSVPAATLERADYTAWLAGYPSEGETGRPPNLADGSPLPAGRPTGPTLLGNAALSILGSQQQEAFCALGSMRLAIEGAEWETGQHAQLGLDEGGRTTLRVPAGSTRLHFQWSLAGEPTPNGCSFRLQFPAASIQRLSMVLPEGLEPLVPGGIVEGPFPSGQPQWRQWRVQVTSQAGALLHVFRSDTTDRDPEIVVAESTAYNLSQAGVEWSVRFDLHVLQGVLEKLEFAFDGQVQIREATLSQPGLVPGLFPNVALSGEVESPGHWTASLPDPLSGAARVVLRGSTPLLTGKRWQLPRIHLATGRWQQGSAQLSVKAPLVVAALETEHGRQTNSEVTVRDPGNPAERHSFQFHEPDGRISVLLDLQRPDLVCHTADRLEWSADSVSLTSYGEWSVQTGRVFRLQYHVPSGWNVHQVEIQARSSAGKWSRQPALLRDWQQGPESLEVYLAQPVTAQGAVRTVVVARRAARTESLPLGELLQFTAREARSSGLLSLAAVGPFRIESEELAADLTVAEDAPDLEDWREAIPVPARGLVIRKDRRASGALLRLLPQRADYQATVEVRAALLSDSLVEQYILYFEPGATKPVGRLLVYFSVPLGEGLQWGVQRRVATSGEAPLQSRRLRPESHDLWGLPSTGELWEILLPREYTHRLVLVAQRHRGVEGSYDVALPIMPEASRVVGQVWLGTDGADRLEVDQEGLTLLSGGAPIRGWGNAGTAREVASRFPFTAETAEGIRLRQVGIWSYASATAQLHLSRLPFPTASALAGSGEDGRIACPNAFVETTAQPNGSLETQVTYWLLPHRANEVRLRLPRPARLTAVVVNGHSLGPEALELNRQQLVVHLRRTDEMQTLRVRFRSGPRQVRVGAGRYWLPCPLSRVAVGLPEVDFVVSALQWGLMLPTDYQPVAVPGALVRLSTAGENSWSQRFFGPLGRSRGSRPFDPWRRADWESLLDLQGTRHPGEAAASLAVPPGSPRDARNLAPLSPGWKRIWLETTLAPAELSLTVARTSSLNLLAIAAFILGGVIGLVVWRAMPRSRSVAVPFVLAAGWSLAVSLPDALSMLGADIALGALLAAAWESRPRPPAVTDAVDLTGSTIKQFAVTASLIAMAVIVVPAALPAHVYGGALSRTPASLLGSAVSQESVRATGQEASDRESQDQGEIPSAGHDDVDGQPIGPAGNGGARRPVYILSGGRCKGTLRDGQLHLTASYHVSVLEAGVGKAARVRFGLDPRRAGLREEVRCTKDGQAVPVSAVVAQDGLQMRFDQPGEYEVELQLAPLWDPPEADQVLKWHCAIPPLPQGSLQLEVAAGQSAVEVSGAVGAVEREPGATHTTVRASLGNASELRVEHTGAPRERRIEASEAFVLDLASQPVLHGWLRYQVSGGTVRQVYLSLEPGMRVPKVWFGEEELATTVLAAPPGVPPVAVVDLGRHLGGTFVLHVEVPVERFEGQRPVGRLRVPKLFAQLVERRTGLLAVPSSSRLTVRVEQPDEPSLVSQGQFAEAVANWGVDELIRDAERVGLVVPWEPAVAPLVLSIRPSDAPALADQTLNVEVHHEDLGVHFQAEISPDQSSGYQRRLRLSPEIEVEDVTVEPEELLRRWERNDAEPGELTLFFSESPVSPHTIDLRGFVAADGAERPLPQVELVGVRSGEHLVVLYVEPDLKAELTNPEHLTQLPEFRGVPAKNDRGDSLKAVYRVTDSRYSADVKVDDSSDGAGGEEPPAEVARSDKPEEVAEGRAGGPVAAFTGSDRGAEPPNGNAVVLLADAVFSLGDTGRYVGQVTYWTASVPAGEFVFRLPGREAELIATTVNASVVNAVPDNAGQYHIPLRVRSLPQSVVIHWQGELTWPAALGEVLLPAPVLESAEVRQSVWQLQWPRGQRPWAPMEDAQTIDATTRDAARLATLLQCAQLLVDHRPALPDRYLEGRLEQLLNAFAVLVQQEPIARARRDSSSAEATHIENLVDRARLLAERASVSVAWSNPSEAWPVLPVLPSDWRVDSTSLGAAPVTYAAALSRQPGPTIKTRVVANRWLATLEKIAAIVVLWLLAMIAGIVSRRRWFHAAPVTRNVVVLAVVGVAWWLWLYPSFAGLLIILTSPILGWSLHRHRSVVRGTGA